MLYSLNILKIEKFDLGFARLKKAPLENSGSEIIYEFKTAKISLSNFYYKDILPSTYYALEKNYQFQIEFKEKLLELKIDLFNLPGIIYFEINGVKRGLVPPYVEYYIEEDNNKVKILRDGIHRFLLAKKLGINQKCIVIENYSKKRKYLPYAYPNNWNEVILQEKVPKIKKRYRRFPHYSYMQPLSCIFEGDLSHIHEYGRI